MFPYNEGLITALIKLRQTEIRREFEREHLAQAARAARQTPPRRLAAQLQRVRRWTTAVATMPPQRCAPADPDMLSAWRRMIATVPGTPWKFAPEAASLSQ